MANPEGKCSYRINLKNEKIQRKRGNYGQIQKR